MNKEKMTQLGQMIDPSITVNEKEFARYTMANVFCATPHIGRDRGTYSLPKNLGLKTEDFDEKSSAFFAGHVTGGHVSFIPDEAERRLDTLEAQLRNAVKSAAICDSYIPVASYEALCKRFAETKAAYLAERDRLIDDWDSLVDDFKDGVAKIIASAVGLTPDQQGRLYDSLVRAVPTKERFRSSFYMSLDITAFPAEQPPEGLDEALTAAIASGTQNQLYGFALQAIEACVGKAWSILSSAATGYINDARVHPRTMTSIATTSVELGVKNVFNNRLLTELKYKLDRIAKEVDSDKRQEIVEESMLDIYSYAKETGISLSMKSCPWKEQELYDMLETRNWVEQQQLRFA